MALLDVASKLKSGLGAVGRGAVRVAPKLVGAAVRASLPGAVVTGLLKPKTISEDSGMWMGNEFVRESDPNYRKKLDEYSRTQMTPHASFDTTFDKNSTEAPTYEEAVQSRGYADASDETKAKFAKNLGKAYGSFRDDLDAMSGFSRGEESKMLEKIQGLGRQLRTGLKADLAGQRKVLDTERGNLEGYQRDTLQGLSEAVAGQMRAANDYLGVRGAGDSSASGMYARGLMGEAERNRRQVLEGAREQYAEIETRRSQADQFYEVQTNAIERQVREREEMVKRDYAKQRSRLAKLASNANDYEREDLERQNNENLAKAQQSLAQISQARDQWVGQLQEWRNDVYGRMDELKNQLIGMTKFSAEEIAMPELDADLENNMPTYDDEYGVALRKRKNSLRDFLDNPIGKY